MMDRINVKVNCDDECRKAFDEYREYIMSETLALSLDYVTEEMESFKLNGHMTGIEVKKVEI